jgi:hypothetical protein
LKVVVRMGISRRWVKRLERDARGNLDSFQLEDGSRFYFDPASFEVFLHTTECLKAQSEGKTIFPEPPPVVKAIARARNRTAALNKVFEGGFMVMPYDTEALIERGEFVPVSMVVGCELGEAAEDLSE